MFGYFNFLSHLFARSAVSPTLADVRHILDIVARTHVLLYSPATTTSHHPTPPPRCLPFFFFKKKKELRADQIPTATSPDGNVSVKVIAGTCYGVESPVFTLTPTLLWDVTMIFPSPSLSPTTTCNEVVFEQQVPDHYNTFIYVLHGTVVCGKRNRVEAVCGSCVVFGPGQCVRVKLPCDSGDGERGRRCRFVVAAGEPLNEPVVQHGPFVMNNWDQIMKAFRDFSEGKF